MNNDNFLDTSVQDITIPETQDILTTFSKKIARKLGLHQSTSTSTDTINNHITRWMHGIMEQA